MPPNQFSLEEFTGLVSVVRLPRIRQSVRQLINKVAMIRTGQTYSGPRAELSCTLRSLPSFPKIET